MQQVRDLDERLAEHDGFRQSLEEKLRHARDALEHYRAATKEQREQETRRHEQQVQQLQAELRQANQTLIIKQNEITQLNKDSARLLAEAGAANRQVREWQAQCEQTQAALNRALTDGARAAVELTHAEALSRKLQTTAATQGDELATARQQRDVLSVDLTKLAAQLEAQQQLLADYRARLGIDSHSAESARFRMKRTRFGENMFSYSRDFKGNIKANRQILHEKDDYPLKAAHPKTRERYREVCALLFFRHGITPTANVCINWSVAAAWARRPPCSANSGRNCARRAGSASNIPICPPISVRPPANWYPLWTRATASAEAALDALRGEVEAQRAEAQHSVVAARDELGRVETALEQRTAALLAAQIEIRDLEKTQAEGHAQRQALEAELARIKAALAARDHELVEAREGFSGELGKQREAAERAEERLRASASTSSAGRHTQPRIAHHEAVEAEICRFYTGADISQGNSMRPVIVRRSSVHGNGVFAMRPLAAGERVLEYKGEITSWRDAVRRRQREDVEGHTFLFGLSDGRVIDGGRGGNSARWLNHACAPNCETIEDAGRIFIHTLRPIEAGEEPFIEYLLATDDPRDEEVRAQYACRCVCGRLSPVDAGGLGVNRTEQDGKGSVAHPGSGLVQKRPNGGVVRICVDAVFHLDVLKPALPKGDASDGSPGANAKKQMSLDLDEL